jgi:P4 family phage/plasmid primase-like protien
MDNKTKIIAKFRKFLNEHRIKKEDKASGDRIQTHTIMSETLGVYNGSFSISDADMSQFLNIYKEVVKLQNADSSITLHIVERQDEQTSIGPLAVDLDFRQNEETRNYTLQDVHYMIELYNKTILKYLDVQAEEINAFVSEKAKPSYDAGQSNYKDGFHIIYPNIVVPADFRYKILDEVLEQVRLDESQNRKGLTGIKYTNTLEDIFDKSIVLANGWMLYGSQKSLSTQKYELTHIYNINLDEGDIEDYSVDELVELLSMRNRSDELVSYNEQYANDSKFKADLEKILAKNVGGNKKKLNMNMKKITKKIIRSDSDNSDMGSDIGSDHDRNSDNEADDTSNSPSIGATTAISNYNKFNSANKHQINDLDMAVKLAALLKKKRAADYQSWSKVGWCLHSISPKLFNAFDKFSQKDISKYDKEGCKKVWLATTKSGFTIATLHWWAREDNPGEYVKLLRENIQDIIKDAENGNHDDISKIAYVYYKSFYVCSSIKKNIWYEFRNHKWTLVDGAYTLLNKFSDEISQEFLRYSSVNASEGYLIENKRQSKMIMEKAKDMMEIAYKLKDVPFKKNILEACRSKFYIEKFEEKLDDCPWLLGFNNGIYDLNNHCFRKGVPDDYVTLSTGYDYLEYTYDHPDVIAIEDFFGKIQTSNDMKVYLLTLIASYLDGRNKEQEFIIWTGNGSNGKSTVMDLIKYTFGDYFSILPITVLTRKRGNAGNASPELADKRGVRFCGIQEPEHDDVIHVGLMKELTGNDTILARALYSDPFYYKPQFKLVLTCNKLPHIPSNDGGVWRRLCVSPFEAKFVDKPSAPNEFLKDKALVEKLADWKQPFIWLLLNKYYKAYMSVGLVKPDIVKKYTFIYQSLNTHPLI